MPYILNQNLEPIVFFWCNTRINIKCQRRKNGPDVLIKKGYFLLLLARPELQKLFLVLPFSFHFHLKFSLMFEASSSKSTVTVIYVEPDFFLLLFFYLSTTFGKFFIYKTLCSSKGFCGSFSIVKRTHLNCFLN